MSLFNKNYNPSIINPLVTVERIQKYSDKNHLFLDVSEDDSSLWFAFSHMQGSANGLSFVESSSFAYFISLLLTGTGIHFNTDMYFREDDIEYRVFKFYDELKEEMDDEEEIVKKLFYEIMNLYEWEIEKYSLKTNSLNFRLSLSDFQRFMDVEGDSKTEKLRNLLKKYNE